jgi:hypothetical protein
MDPVGETPTESVDYAVLTAAYGSLLGAVVLAARSGRHADPPGAREILPLGAATFALSKAIAHEQVEGWLREPFVGGRERRTSPEGPA